MWVALVPPDCGVDPANVLGPTIVHGCLSVPAGIGSDRVDEQAGRHRVRPAAGEFPQIGRHPAALPQGTQYPAQRDAGRRSQRPLVPWGNGLAELRRTAHRRPGVVVALCLRGDQQDLGQRVCRRRAHPGSLPAEPAAKHVRVIARASGTVRSVPFWGPTPWRSRTTLLLATLLRCPLLLVPLAHPSLPPAAIVLRP